MGILSEMEPGELARVLVRVPVGLGWTLGSYGVARARQLLFQAAWGDRNYQDVIKVWGTGLSWIMGVRVVRRGERVGPMGDLIIANHMGFLDVPALLTVYPAVFMISEEFTRFFFVGPKLRHQGHVFVERGSEASRRSAREGLRRVLERGERIIVFPEGRSSPGAERLPFKPFSFHEAARQGKRVEACVIDYLPDRRVLEWDNRKPLLPQILKLLGRKRTEVSLEFLPSEVIADPEEAVQHYHDLIEARLRAHDGEHQAPMGDPCSSEGKGAGSLGSRLSGLHSMAGLCTALPGLAPLAARSSLS